MSSAPSSEASDLAVTAHIGRADFRLTRKAPMGRKGSVVTGCFRPIAAVRDAYETNVNLRCDPRPTQLDTQLAMHRVGVAQGLQHVDSVGIAAGRQGTRNEVAERRAA